MNRYAPHVRKLAALAFALALAPGAAGEEEPKPPRLPFLGEEARKRGIELPLPLGFGVVYYHLDRDIEVTDVRVGRNGAQPVSVSDFAQFGSDSRVDNLNLKLDVWLLPFLNLYAIAGYILNESTTNVEVTLPPILPGGPRTRRVEVPTELEGSVGGLGLTLAGGYGPFFMAGDVNWARADLGFDDRFRAVVASLRAGWHGELDERPVRVWLNTTYWDTFAQATGTVSDPDNGGMLAFEVDQGPAYPWTYGIGASYTIRPEFDLAVDAGSDFNGGWYVAIVPVFRFRGF